MEFVFTENEKREYVIPDNLIDIPEINQVSAIRLVQRSRNE
ncbi:hypothetical protein AB3Z07_27010 (plasmid) [Metabacillus halosaccharovorans]|nr:hypothetical protein [Metabacillus halosaccharovorans]